MYHQIPSATGKNNQYSKEKNDGGGTFQSKKQAAIEAGMSERQRNTAQRVANIPNDEFEELVESDNPPTVTELAKKGTQQRKPVTNLEGRDPQDFSASTKAQGLLREAAKAADTLDPETIVRGALPNEHAAIRKHIQAIDAWLDKIIVRLEN